MGGMTKGSEKTTHIAHTRITMGTCTVNFSTFCPTQSLLTRIVDFGKCFFRLLASHFVLSGNFDGNFFLNHFDG